MTQHPALQHTGKSIFCAARLRTYWSWICWGLLTWLAWSGSSRSLAVAAESNERPNVIVILVDDMGFSDIGCYGGEIPTPNIDALAEGGVRFSQFYNTGRCCPTRASLLTGLYAHQTGIGLMNADEHLPAYRGFLNRHCITLGRALGNAGYFTATTGKWHVGARTKAMWPGARGFDRSFSVPQGGGFYFQVRRGREIALNDVVVADQEHPLPEGFYTTDAWTEYGLKFIDEAIAAEQPFFLYLAHNAPHFPLQANEKDIARFRGKYSAGWDELSAVRYQRQLDMGLIDSNWEKAARPSQVAAWDSLSASEQDRFDHLMAAYAACVYRMDLSIGKLVNGLKQRKQYENTLILFLSDNGGNAEAGPDGRSQGDPTAADSNWYCGKSWAWMQNTPFRMYKHFNHEGGIASPLIAHWPAVVPARTGKEDWIKTPAHVIDVMATCIDVAGTTYPKEFAGNKLTPTPGVSLLPLLTGNGEIPERPLYWEHEGNAAIRVGPRKLVRKSKNGAWELFDMQADRTEQHDLAAKQPAEVARLSRQWRNWALKVGALPKPEAQQKLRKKKNKPLKKSKGGA